MLKQLTEYFWFRLLASAAVACAVVVAFVGGAIRYFERPEEDPLMASLQQVRVISLAENPELAEAIRKERERTGDVKPKIPPPPTMSDRQVSGFVQVEYVINPDGTVSDVKVIGAAPRGVYEERAIAQVSRRMHAPVFNDAGEAVARRTTEVVEFTVPASELVSSSRSNN